MKRWKKKLCLIRTEHENGRGGKKILQMLQHRNNAYFQVKDIKFSAYFTQRQTQIVINLMAVVLRYFFSSSFNVCVYFTSIIMPHIKKHYYRFTLMLIIYYIIQFFMTYYKSISFAYSNAVVKYGYTLLLCFVYIHTVYIIVVVNQFDININSIMMNL